MLQSVLLSIVFLLAGVSHGVPLEKRDPEGVVSVPVTNKPKFYETSFHQKYPLYVEFLVGSEKTPIIAAADSGSYDLLLPLTSADQKYHVYGGYDPATSTSSVDLDQSGHVVFGSKRSQGDIKFYEDTLSLGGVSLPNCTFGTFNSTNVNFPVFGLAGTAQDGSKPSFVKSLKDAGKIKSNSWSLYVDSDYNGELIFGGIDQAKYTGELITVKKPAGFGFTAPQIRIHNSIYAYAGTVIMDCGWDVGIGLPTDMYNQVHQEWYAKADANGCNGPDDLFIELFAETGSLRFYAKELIRTNDQGQCTLDVGNTGHNAVLGTWAYPLIYMSANFDKNTVSLAKAKTTTERNVVAIE